MNKIMDGATKWGVAWKEELERFSPWLCLKQTRKEGESGKKYSDESLSLWSVLYIKALHEKEIDDGVGSSTMVVSSVLFCKRMGQWVKIHGFYVPERIG